MSKHLVTFVGQPCPAGKDPAHFKAADREVVSFAGIDFPKGEPVACEFASPKGQAALAKLKGNRHFRVEDVVEPAAAPSDDPAHSPEAVAKREARAAKKAAKAE